MKRARPDNLDFSTLPSDVSRQVLVPVMMRKLKMYERTCHLASSKVFCCKYEGGCDRMMIKYTDGKYVVDCYDLESYFAKRSLWNATSGTLQLLP